MAEEVGFDYSILRPGRLPNKEGKDDPAKKMLSLKQGDEEAGDTSLASVAATFAQV